MAAGILKELSARLITSRQHSWSKKGFHNLCPSFLSGIQGETVLYLNSRQAQVKGVIPKNKIE